MIAMILLALIGVYIGLFVFAGYRNKNPKQRWTWWVILLLPVIYLTWDIPVGYIAFKSACAREGGLKVYKQPEPADTLRLGNGFSSLTAEGLLKTFPSLKIVEVRDPIGYGNFRKFMRGADGAVNIEEFDPKQQPNFNIEGSTTAAYLIREEEHKESRFRLGRNRYMLKTAGGENVAVFTNFQTAWSIDTNTLLGRAIGVDFCYYESNPENELTKLIAKSGTQ